MMNGIIDPAERKYKAEDLWLTGQNTDNQFRSKRMASARARSDSLFDHY